MPALADLPMIVAILGVAAVLMGRVGVRVPVRVRAKSRRPRR